MKHVPGGLCDLPDTRESELSRRTADRLPASHVRAHCHAAGHSCRSKPARRTVSKIFSQQAVRLLSILHTKGPERSVVLRILVILAFLFPIVPTWSEDSILRTGFDSRAMETGHWVARSKVLMDQGQHIEALNILERLVESPPSSPQVYFTVGLAAVEASWLPDLTGRTRNAFLDVAIKVFDTILISMPESPRVRLELARAFFLKQEDALAKAQFERVLAGHPPTGVTDNIQRYLVEIRRRKRWSAYFGFALMPDSNIGSESDERTISIFGLPFERDQEELTRSGTGLSLWGGGEYRYSLGNRLWLRLGGDLSRQEYSARLYDRTTLSAYAGPLWHIGNNTRVRTQAIVRHHQSANRPHSQEWGISARMSRPFTRRMAGSVQASWVERRHDIQRALDGPVMSLSVTAKQVLTSMLLADLTLGWADSRTERENQRNTSHWVQTGLTSAFSKGLTMHGGVLLRWTDYEGDWFPFTSGSPREDLLYRYSISGHHLRFSWWGANPKLSLVHEERESNAQTQNYQRTFGELSFVWLF